MPITCRVCKATIAPMEGARCRSCRRLVCETCVAERREEDNSVLCSECATPTEPAEAPDSDNAIDEAESPNLVALLPDWKWGLFAAFLAALFLLLAFAPSIKARSLAARLSAQTPSVADQAEEDLILLGGRAVFVEMGHIVSRSLKPKARVRAIRILGKLARPEALDMLSRIRKDEKESSQTREAARVAILEIEEAQ